MLNEKYSNLLSERYEAYNLSNHNLENEELLINLNDEKTTLNNEINNLDIYKKFLKKTKLQKEYQEITEYFKKKQELKNKEKYINKLLTYNNEEINYGFINELREEYALYLSILDTSKEEKDRIRIKEEKINLLKSPLDKYDYVEQLPKNILNILEKLKIRREVLKEKVDINKSIENEIEFLNLKQQEAKDIIGNSVSISKFREEIGTLLNTYEEKLKELKYLVEDNTELRKNNIFYLSLLVISIMSIIFAILLKNKILSIIMLIIFFGTTSILLINIYVNKSFKNHNKKVEVIKRNINQIENDLNYYCKELQINDYKELFKKLKIYDDYRKLEVKINEKIKDKLLQKKLLDLDKAINEYEIINKDINRYLTISRVDNLEKLINDVNKYEESYKGFESRR